MLQSRAVTHAECRRTIARPLRHRITTLVISTVVMLVAQLLHTQSVHADPSSRPNVILIMTDDQGYGDVGFHGNKMIQTPELDRLAKEAVELTDYHVDPTCSETRSALMTGRYSTRVGVWHTIMGRSILRQDETTMADVFAQSGYRTGIFGKWHLGDNYPYRPQDRGFQEVVIHGGGGVGQTPDYWGNDYFDDTYFHNGVPRKQSGYCTDVFFDHALKFIEANGEQPFFCYLPTNAAHGPFNVDPSYARPYLEKGVPQPMANFYGMITNIDENVGRLRAHLQKLGLDRNTLVIFSTDNGTAAGVARRPGDGYPGFNAGLRGQKGSQYDGGHRVPCLVHWPAGNVTGGRKVDTLAAHLDWLPTLVDICKLKSPDVAFDGRSLKSELLDESGDETPSAGRALVVNSQRIDHPEKWRKCSVMTDRWRLVDGEQLYDMNMDRGQQKDVAEQHPQIVAELRQVYEKWWASVSKRFDEYVRIPLGHEQANPTTLTCHDWHGPGVPWNQGHIERMMRANGFWAVDVAQPGEFEFELRARPEGVTHRFEEGTATVRIDEQVASVDIEPGSDVIRLRLKLEAGPAELRTNIAEVQRGSRGAYYVTVRRLDGDAPVNATGATLNLEAGDRLLLLGGTFIERMQAFDYFEAALHAAHPGMPVVVRNLGWSGDTVSGVSRALFGSEEEGFQRLVKDVQLVKPTVIALAYGGNEAHAGVDGQADFHQKLERLLDTLAEKTEARVVILAPRPYEAVSGIPFDPDQYNTKLSSYTKILADEARHRHLDFVDLADLHVSGLTSNGVHLTPYGYWHLAPRLLRQLGVVTDPWRVTIDLATSAADDLPTFRATNTAISDLGRTEDSVSFKARDRYLPLPPPPPPASDGDDLPRVPLSAEHQTSVLTVQGLTSGRYELRVDDEPVMTAPAEQWSAGITLPNRGGSDQVEQLRELIRRKNQLFFHRYRPQNETYLFLFRKHEQGNNAAEIPQFDPLVEQLDEQITELSRPRTHRYQLVRLP